jgi:hypothetical protein
LGVKGLVILCSSSADGEVRDAWEKISLPGRDYLSCSNFARKRWNPYNYKGNWIEEEEDELIDHINQLGQEWKRISSLMGRTTGDIRNKWRELGGNTYLEKRKDEWSIEEILNLLLLVENDSGMKFLKADIESCIAEQLKLQARSLVKKEGKNEFYFGGSNRLESLKDFLAAIHEDVVIPIKGINWNTIAHNLPNRSPNDCKEKWKRQLHPMLTSKKHFTAMNDIEIARAYYQIFNRIEYSFKEWKNIWILTLKNSILLKEQKRM